MTIYGRQITDEDMSMIASYMDDDLREMVHSQITEETTNEDFISMYLDVDDSGELLYILKNEFDFEY